MQISDLVLYDFSNRKRILSFRQGCVNIISGGSRTGKSAIIDIIDYCLGSRNCHIADGDILEKVSWYGIKLQFPAWQIFLARENPPRGIATTNKMYFEQGDKIDIPEIDELISNTNRGAVVKQLSNLIGISSNKQKPLPGQTRAPLEINIRHGLFYCFQDQNEIDSKYFLFHRQSEPFVGLRVNDTLPYFLGAIQEDQLSLEQELARARRDLKRVERSIQETEEIRGEGGSKAISLLSEACEAGIISIDRIPTELDKITPLMRQISQWVPSTGDNTNPSRLLSLNQEIKDLKAQLDLIAYAINDAKSFANELEGFTSETSQQKARLESIGLFKESLHPDICPLCNQEMYKPIPSANAIKSSLHQVSKNLESTVRERPKIRGHIEKLEREKECIKVELILKKEAVKGIIKETESSKKLHDFDIIRGKVVGRISLWLESVDLTDELAGHRANLARLQRTVEFLESQLNTDEKDERLSSILNRIGIVMTKWAQSLKLEHSQNPVRLDVKNATVVIDREDNRPIPLQRMGSGENWVGYHLITYLALHQHFCKHSRPLPRFVFFDQPSKAYFPTDRDDEDTQAVSRMYNLIFDVVDSLEGNLQVIITDHAEIMNDRRFMSAIVERWSKDGPALIPREWY